jgi:hypothetical protein
MFVTCTIGGDDVIDAAHDDRNVLFDFTSQRTQIPEIAQIAADVMHRCQRFARQVREIRAAPLFDQIATALDPQTIAEIVREHDRKAREQIILDVAGEIDEPLADRDSIVNVAVQDELPVRATFVGARKLACPGRRAFRCRHRFAVSGWQLTVGGWQ